MKDCKCTEPCDTMKYTAYLSYGAFPGLASAIEYAGNNTEMFKNLTYVTFQYFVLLSKDFRARKNPRITLICKNTEKQHKTKYFQCHSQCLILEKSL